MKKKKPVSTPRLEKLEARFNTSPDNLTRLSRSNEINSIEISKNNESEFIADVKKITPEDFMAHTVLGKGSFGEV